MYQFGSKIIVYCPGWVAQLIGALTPTPEACGFDSRPGHIPRLQVRSPVQVCTGAAKQFLFTSVFLSLFSSSLLEINKHIHT